MRKPLNEATLFGGNFNMTLDLMSTKDGSKTLSQIVALIAEVFDQAAGGEDVYITFGRNRAKTAFVATVTWDGEKMYAPGLDLAAVADACGSLLDTPETS